MDMSFSAADREFRDGVRDFLARKLPADVAHKVHAGFQVSRAETMHWHKTLYEQGWVAPNWPTEYGGPGWSVTQKYIWDEESTLAGAPRLIMFGITMCGPVLMGFGTPEQKRHYLPRILTGEHIWCQGYSEPGSGSDLASLKCRADRDGDHFVINGSKLWTTSAHHANMVFCLVRTSSKGKRQEGITFILIDMATPGIEVKPLITIEGLHEVNQVFFTDVRVPAENVVGERMSGGALGTQKKLLAQLKQLAGDEVSNGAKLIEDATFARKIAEVEIELMTLEVFMLRLLAAVSADREMGAEASIVKIRRTEIHQKLTELKLEAAGYYGQPFVKAVLIDGWNEEPIGFEHANTLAPSYFNNRKLTIFAGSNEIQHNVIAKGVLGL